MPNNKTIREDFEECAGLQCKHETSKKHYVVNEEELKQTFNSLLLTQLQEIEDMVEGAKKHELKGHEQQMYDTALDRVLSALKEKKKTLSITSKK